VIYPTSRAVLLAAIGAPATFALAAVNPELWYLGIIWIALIAALLLADAGVAALGRGFKLDLEHPRVLAIGGEGRARITATFPNAGLLRSAELTLEADDRITVSPLKATAPIRGGRAEAEVLLTPRRRGEAMLKRVWVRWRGPLGLAFAQQVQTVDRASPVVPNVEAVKSEAMRLFARDAMFGVKTQMDTGEGAEFHALKDFVPGMDRRTVDWKRSARHGRLVAKEFRTERNHHVILALDTGRAMSEPLACLPRIDRAINAALLLAFVSLKIGDRVGLFSFDARPRLSTGAAVGARSFGLLQRLAARIDYSVDETNYTLGLTALSGELERRSLIVVFTEFTDPTNAELMIENVGRLLRRHLVLFVAMRDEELEAIARAEPKEPADVSKAVTAAALLRERELVISRLTRMGVHVVDVPADALAPALVTRYLDLKRRDLV
jgi:uncharacterized protein (DUF58 family)